MTARLLTRPSTLLAVAVTVIAVVVAGPRLADWMGEDAADLVVTADFDDTTGLYVGNRVTYLGVPVGKVTEVMPDGPTMQVTLRLEPDTRVPREAGAEIVQGSLVTDRYVELGPAYTGGPALADGAHIDNAHTRAPATVDEIATAVDNLVLALDADGRGGEDLGELLATTANGLADNGPAISDALAKGQRALSILNSKGSDLESVSQALADLVAMVSARDEVIRTFVGHSGDAVGVLADQRSEIEATLAAFDELIRLTEKFLKQNGDVLADDLALIDDIAAVVGENQDSLEESFDTMPAMAENFARAYDWDLGRLRVQFSFDAGPFNSVFMSHFCHSFADVLGAGQGCDLLFQPDGSGLLDPLITGLLDALPLEVL